MMKAPSSEGAFVVGDIDKGTATSETQMSSLPFMPPDTKCNARLTRSSGYCELAAGGGTKHEGIGRCYMHGGATPKHDVPDGPRDLFRAAGLEQIINLAETMSSEDQEYLMHVGNNALVVSRAGILARMQDTSTSPKELADLTMALSRIDNILSKYPDDEDPDSSPNTPDVRLSEEMARLAAIDQG